MKGTRTNVTDEYYNNAVKQGVSNLVASTLWREGSHRLMPSDDLHFESDRFTFGDRIGAVMTIMLKEGSNYKLPRAWGVNAIPTLDDDNAHVSVAILMNVDTIPEGEVTDKLTEATKSARGSLEEAEEAGQIQDASAAQQLAYDMYDVAEELKSGSYLGLSLRLVVTAEDDPKNKVSREQVLDRALSQIEINYSHYFNKVSLQQFVGQQQDDFKNLLKLPKDQLGKNYKMTSEELAGMSPFVTRGLEDESGVFVGTLTNDVNSGAVMLDTQKFDRLALVGARGEAVVGTQTLYGISKSSLWGVQYAQDALIHGHKVHQVILNEAQPLDYGVDLNDITTTVNLEKGQINVLEVFGDKSKELELFSVQLEKLKLIVRQLNPDVKVEDLQLLSQVLEEFYIDEGKWVPNAKRHVDELRLVGIPSTQVPRFEKIPAYMQRATMDALHVGSNTKYDKSDLERLKMFKRMFDELNNSYGDVFGRITNLDTERIKRSYQTVYQFSGLRNRGEGVFMAQVINALAYLSGNISRDDVIIIHGANLLKPSMYDFFVKQIEYYWSVGAKVVMLFDSVNEMLNSQLYDDANTVLIGPSSTAELNILDSKFDSPLPQAVRNVLSEQGSQNSYYFRRGMESALFDWEASL